MRTLPQIQRDMHDYLPRYYEEVPVAVNVIDQEAVEIAQLNADIYDVLAQFFVDTATWSLARWERNFGLIPDDTKPADQRRAVIKSRLRGVGTVTPELIEQVAEAFVNGDVDVTEDNANFIVTITFTSVLGIPPNVGDLEDAIRDLLPAHLNVVYEFTYVTFGQLESYGATYGDIEIVGLTFGQLETWGGP